MTKPFFDWLARGIVESAGMKTYQTTTLLCFDTKPTLGAVDTNSLTMTVHSVWNG